MTTAASDILSSKPATARPSSEQMQSSRRALALAMKMRLADGMCLARARSASPYARTHKHTKRSLSPDTLCRTKRMHHAFTSENW